MLQWLKTRQIAVNVFFFNLLRPCTHVKRVMIKNIVLQVAESEDGSTKADG